LVNDYASLTSDPFLDILRTVPTVWVAHSYRVPIRTKLGTIRIVPKDADIGDTIYILFGG
jgi:hypothetical protein